MSGVVGRRNVPEGGGCAGDCALPLVPCGRSVCSAGSLCCMGPGPCSEDWRGRGAGGHRAVSGAEARHPPGGGPSGPTAAPAAGALATGPLRREPRVSGSVLPTPRPAPLDPPAGVAGAPSSAGPTAVGGRTAPPRPPVFTLGGAAKGPEPPLGPRPVAGAATMSHWSQQTRPWGPPRAPPTAPVLVCRDQSGREAQASSLRSPEGLEGACPLGWWRPESEGLNERRRCHLQDAEAFEAGLPSAARPFKAPVRASVP